MNYLGGHESGKASEFMQSGAMGMSNKKMAQAEARQNLERLSRLVPLDLQDRENNLVDSFRKHRGNLFDKLQFLYSFMDELSAYVGKVTPCKKGCSYCCHIPISISALELEYVRHLVPDLRKKIGQGDMGSGGPCPFLFNQSCSIYDVRPYVCRKHVVFTNSSYWCHPARCHSVKLTMLELSEVRRVYYLLLFESDALARRFDIRECGKELLDGYDIGHKW